MIANATLIL